MAATLWGFSATPWARHLAERAISERTGLHCQIGTIRPPGWPGGWRVSRIRLTPPELATDPLASAVEIESVRGRISRRGLLHGRLDLSLLEMEGVTIRWRLGDRFTRPGPLETVPEPAFPGPPAHDTPPPADSVAGAAPGLADAAAPPHRASARIPQLDDPAPPGGQDTAAEPSADRPISLWEGGPALPEIALANLLEPDAVPPGPLDHASEDLAPPPAPDPAGPPAASTGQGLLSSLKPATAAPSGGTPAFSPAALPPGANLWPASRRWSVAAVRIASGRLLIVDRDGQRPLCEIGRWEAVTPLPFMVKPPERLGLLEAGGCRIAGRPQTGSLRAELHWQGDACTVKNLDLQLPGNGRATGGVRLLPFRGDGPCTGSIELHESSLADLAGPVLPAHAAAPSGTCHGKVDFTVHLRRPRTLRLQGSFTATGLTFPLAEWARLAGLDRLASEIKSPVFPAREIRAEIRAAAGNLAIDDATLSADDLTLKSRGLLTTRGTVEAVTRCYVTAAGRDSIAHLTAAWPADRRPWFAALDSSPWYYHDLAIAGTLGSPRIEEWGRLWSPREIRAEILRLQSLPQPPL